MHISAQPIEGTPPDTDSSPVARGNPSRTLFDRYGDFSGSGTRQDYFRGQLFIVATVLPALAAILGLAVWRQQLMNSGDLPLSPAGDFPAYVYHIGLICFVLTCAVSLWSAALLCPVMALFWRTVRSRSTNRGGALLGILVLAGGSWMLAYEAAYLIEVPPYEWGYIADNALWMTAFWAVIFVALSPLLSMVVPAVLTGKSVASDGAPLADSKPTPRRDALQSFFSGYADFMGRTSRSDYWGITGILMLTFPIILLLTSIVSNYAIDSESNLRSLELLAMSVLTLAALAPAIPFLAMTVRRFRDVGFATTPAFVAVGVMVFIAATLSLVINQGVEDSLPAVVIFSGLLLPFIALVQAPWTSRKSVGIAG